MAVLGVGMDLINNLYTMIAITLPNVIGAIIVLLVGWIVGRLLGALVRIVLNKVNMSTLVPHSPFAGSMEKAGVTLGYIGDIAVRFFIYLIAVVGAVEILNLQYLSKLMVDIVGYIPHIVAFGVILIVGFILIDYFVDFLGKFYGPSHVDLVTPVLFLVRIFLYFVLVVLSLSQLMLDLTIIYTFITPIAWGIGLGIGAAIAIIVGFGLKNKSEAIMEKVIESFLKH
ncbi:MAG: hypothetical protein ABR887_00875 [Methanoregulaceae archaeon]|jgi:hypothetical protein